MFASIPIRRCQVRAVAMLVLIGASAAGVAPVQADLVSLFPRNDNTLYETLDGSTSNGAGSAMFAGRNSATTNSRRRALVAFAVAGGVPAGASIDSVTLTLWNSAANVSPETIRLHRLLADWGEGASVGTGNQGGGGPASAGDATWLHRFHDTQTWNQYGGDFDPSACAASVVAGPGSYDWTSTSGFITDTQLFLDQPGANFGWVLIGNEALPGTAKRFGTREEPDPLLRPVLTIEYTPIPEPGTFLTWLIVFGVWVRRSR